MHGGRWLAALGVLAVLAAGGRAVGGGGRGSHKELYVVPAGEVTVDGSLGDWDLSGAVEHYVVPETRQTQSAKLAMMYDAEALYIAGMVRDSSPMMNRHDPLTKPSRAWDADVCQIFFSRDPDDTQPLPYSSFKDEHKHVSPVATMMLWYFTDRKEPSLAMFRGMGFTKPVRPDLHENGHIPSEHFDAAYKKGDDGLSFTFEYRIPWKTFAMERTPKAEDTLACSTAVFWGRPDGLKTAGGASWAYNVMSEPGFPFQQANCWGTLRFSPKGNIPREWVEADLPPERPLPLSFRYEMPREGECTVQLFDAENRSARILVAQQRRPEGVNTEQWDGLDAKGKPLPAGTYRWAGVVHDPIKVKYRFSVHNSGQPPYPTDDNTGGWGGDHGRPSTVLGFKKGMILAWDSCEYGWGLIRTDLAGKKKWGSKRTAEHLATDGKRLFVAGGHGWSATPGVKVLNLADSRPLSFRPGVEALLPPDGGTEETNAVTGLACDGERIYVAYGGRGVIRVHGLDGKLSAEWKVPRPGRVAVRPDGSLAVVSGGRVLAVAGGKVSGALVEGLAEPRGLAVSKGGEIFVALAGEAQQVQVFSAEGKRLRTIGRDGGRPAKGRYDPSGMYQPGGIDLDSRGRLWVAETTDGPKRVSVWDAKTGRNVDEFFGSSGYFAYGNIDPARPDEILAHHVLWRIDWKKYEARPTTTIWRKTAPNMVPSVGPSAYVDQARMLTAENGRQYLYGRNRPRRSTMNIVMRRDGDLFKPFLAVFQGATGIPAVDERELNFREGDCLWQDTNDDQCVQWSEVTRLPREMPHHVVVSLGRDLSLYFNDGSRLRPVRTTDAGQPVYDFAKAEKVGVGQAPAHDGFVYTYGGHGGTLARRTQDGEVLWMYEDIVFWKRALGLPPVGPGRLWGMTSRMGVAGEFLAHMTYFGVNHVFHTSGVYTAALLKDGRVQLGRGPYQGQPEGQGGTFVKLTLDGKDRYFVVHGGQDTRVWEVLGLETVEPLAGGAYEHTPAAVAKAAKALEQWREATGQAKQLTIVRGRKKLDEAEPVGKELEGGRGFEVRAAYDRGNLYLRYDVTTPHPLVNATAEETILFRGGNCLDVQFATNPAADSKRTKPAVGDVRVLVTRRDGKALAVVYRPRVAGFDGERIVLRSPTGTEPFDRIETTDRVTLDYEKTDGGFRAVAAIPLKVLGWKPTSGAKVRMDVGYIFGNAKGTRAGARAYWSNNGFSANVVDDIPNESRLEPQHWGTAEVE